MNIKASKCPIKHFNYTLHYPNLTFGYMLCKCQPFFLHWHTATTESYWCTLHALCRDLAVKELGEDAMRTSGLENGWMNTWMRVKMDSWMDNSLSIWIYSHHRLWRNAERASGKFETWIWIHHLSTLPKPQNQKNAKWEHWHSQICLQRVTDFFFLSRNWWKAQDCIRDTYCS